MPPSLSRDSFLALADDLLAQELSYGRGDVEHNYLLPTGEGKLVLDRLAFGRKPQDQESSCLAVHYCPLGSDRDALVTAARILAVPLGFFGRADGHVDVVKWRSDGPPMVIHELAGTDQFRAYVKKHAKQLRASALLEAKRPSGRQRQLTFADAGLLDYAYQVAPKELPTVYQDLATEAAERIRQLRPDCEDPREAALRATILVFGARVLQDKGKFKASTNDAITLLREAGSTDGFPRFFHRIHWQDIPPDVLGWIGDRLRQWRFNFLSPYGLGMLYRHAFVDDDLRRKLAIFYTPLAISEFIVDQLPMEEIPLAQRSALDPTAGSGGVMLTALRRMRRLYKEEKGALPPAAWCRQMVHCRDKDPFACWIAALSLMNETGWNGWDIEGGDLEDLDFRPIARRPTIVIGNPPFRLTRLAIHKAVSELAEGGLIGLVLPYKYRGQGSSKGDASRRELLSNCEILRIADLPPGVFAEAAEPSMILLARKRAGGARAGWMLSESTIEGSPSEYRSRVLRGDFARAREVPQHDWLLQKHCLMKSPLLSDLWARLRQMPSKLATSCERPHVGIQLDRDKAKKAGTASKWVLATNPGGAVPYLEGIRGAGSAFGLPSDTPVSFLQYYEHRDEFEGPRDPRHMEAPKVLLPRTVRIQRAWRLMAYADDVGYFVANSFLYVLPKPKGPDLWLLAAVLNGGVANAWLQEHSTEGNISPTLLGELPLPALSQELAELVSEMSFHLAHLQNRRPNARRKDSSTMQGQEPVVPPWMDWLVRTLMGHVDQLLLDGYGLTDAERDGVFFICPAERRPGLPADAPRSAVETARVEGRRIPGLLRTSGRIIGLDEQKRLAAVAIDGLALGLPVPVALESLPREVRVLGCHIRLRSFLEATRLHEVVLSDIQPFPQADRPRAEVLAELREIAKPTHGEGDRGQ